MLATLVQSLLHMAEYFVHSSPLVELLRVYATESGFSDKDAYLSVLNRVNISKNEVVLTGAKGDFARASVDAVGRELLADGVDTAYVDRAEGHTFPYGEMLYSQDGVTRYKWDLKSGFKPARLQQAERNKGEHMKTLADSNIGSNVTEIKDKDGNLLIKFTREYGSAVPTAEVIQIEAALLELASKLQNA